MSDDDIDDMGDAAIEPSAGVEWTDLAPKEASSLRNKIRTVTGTVETGYLEVAELLHQVATSRVGDRAVFQVWGYDAFADYAERELSLHKRKASSLRRIGELMGALSKEVDPKVYEGLRKIGWTKLRELTRVLTPRNAAELLARVTTMNFYEVAQYVSQYKAAIETASKKPSSAPATGRGGGETLVEGPSFDASDDGDDADDRLDAEPGAERGAGLTPDPAADAFSDFPAGGADLPAAPEAPKRVAFFLYESQLEIVNRAIERAKQLAGSDKPGHALTMMATEFLSSNVFGKSDKSDDSKSLFLSQIAKQLGVEIAAIDNTGKVVYGRDLLEGLLEAMAADKAKGDAP